MQLRGCATSQSRFIWAFHVDILRMSTLRRSPLFWLILAVPLALVSLAFVFSNTVGKHVPDWAPRWTGWSFKHGSQFVVEVDSQSFRRDMNETLRDHVIRELRDAHLSSAVQAG